MPLYSIHIMSSDGAVDSSDLEAIMLDGIGRARALVVETLVECATEHVRPGHSRRVAVTARDERGTEVYREEIVVHGPAPSPQAAELWRAMAAMNGNSTDHRRG